MSLVRLTGDNRSEKSQSGQLPRASLVLQCHSDGVSQRRWVWAWPSSHMHKFGLM